MGVILGFGPHHVNLAKDFVQKMGEEIIQQEFHDVKSLVEKIAKQAGTYKDTEFENVVIRTVFTWSKYEGHQAACVEGVYWHYRDDHPFSPDGFAALGLPFCLVVQVDSIWGKRIYVAID